MFQVDLIAKGLGFLTAIPLIFHLIVFRKSRRFIDVTSSLLLSQLFFALALVSSGILYQFRLVVILGLTLILTLVFRRKIRDLTLGVVSKDLDVSLVILLSSFLVFSVLMLKNVFASPFSGDDFKVYLPFARIIVQEHGILAFHLQNNVQYTVTGPPLLYSLMAFLFLFSGGFNEWVTIALPIFYATLTVLFLWMWSKEEEDSSLSSFVVLSLIMPAAFAFFSVRVLTESMILFYGTTSFYLLFRFVRERKDVFLVLLLAALTLFNMTKFSGFVLGCLFILALVLKTRERKVLKKIFVCGVVVGLPFILWSGWCFLNYGDPTFPYISQDLRGKIFSSEYTRYLAVRASIGSYESEKPENFFGDVFYGMPFIVLALVYILGRIMSFEEFFILFCLLVLHFLNVRFLFPEVRHYYPLYGILAFFSGRLLMKLYDTFSPVFLRQSLTRKFVSSLLLYYVMAYIVVVGFIRRDYPDLWWKWIIVFYFGLGLLKVLGSSLRRFRNLRFSSRFLESFRALTETHIKVAALLLGLLFVILIQAPGDFPSGFNLRETIVFLSEVVSPSNYGESDFYASEEWRVLEFLREVEGGSDVRISGETSNILIWYGNYTLIPFGSRSFLYFNRGELDYFGSGEYFYETFKRLGVEYVYDNGGRVESRLYPQVFSTLDSDRERFKLVYSEGGHRLWRLM